MIDEPIVLKEFKNSEVYNHKFRDEDPKKFKGNALFIIKGFKFESQRIDVPSLTLTSLASHQGVHG